MKIEYEGRPYDLDLTDVELKPAVVITNYTGLSLRKWGEALQDIDSPDFLKSVTAVFWLMLQQNGETCPIADVNFKVGAFTAALGEAMTAELAAAAAELAAQQEPEPDPTLPADSELSPEPASQSQPSTDGEATPDG